MALTTISPALQDSQAQYTGFKNRIINGAMMIDQRNAGASVVQNGGYTLDRWSFETSNTGNNTVQQVSDAPAGFTKSLKITTTTGGSLTSGSYLDVQQTMEGYNFADFNYGTASAQTLTISFWVKSSLTGTFSVNPRLAGGGNVGYVTTYTINAANTWEYKTITVPGNTVTAPVSTTNGVSLVLYFILGVGATYQTATLNTWGSAGSAGYGGASTASTAMLTTTGATWQVTGVQLEKGSTATSFDYRPYGTELALCQRYYFSSFSSDGATPSANVCGTTLSDNLVEALGARTPITMRANPTFTIWNANTGTTGTIRISGANIGVSGLSNVRPDGFSVISLSATGSRAGIGGYSFTASAEL